MNLYKSVHPGKPSEINVVVEIPGGGQNKIEYDPQGFFRLDRGLYSAVHYPFDYGFLPQTLADDGDALDVVLILTHPTFPGCVVKARPIGMLAMRDEEGEDTKIIAVPAQKIDPRYKDVKDLSGLPDHTKKEIEQFMLDYKRLEEKKEVKIEAWKGVEDAEKIIEKCIEKYKEAK